MTMANIVIRPAIKTLPHDANSDSARSSQSSNFSPTASSTDSSQATTRSSSLHKSKSWRLQRAAVQNLTSSSTLLHTKSAPLETLISLITPTPNSDGVDSHALFSFLLGSRFFVRPSKVFDEVCVECARRQASVSGDVSARYSRHVVRLLQDWVTLFPHDFTAPTEDRMMQRLKDLSQRVCLQQMEHRRPIALLMHHLAGRLASRRQYSELLAKIQAETVHRLLHTIPTTDIYEVCCSPTMIAQQLTRIELDRLKMIGVEELIDSFIKGSGKLKEDSRVLVTRSCFALQAYLDWFDRLSYFVATEVCLHLKKRHRAKLIEYFIDVANECFNIGNFNSLMAVISGLNMNQIARLRKTWAKVDKSKFDVLENLTAPQHNFGSYRSTLKAAHWRSASATHDRERVVIPFFSLFCKDVYYLLEGVKTKLPNGDLNFEKFIQVGDQLRQMNKWKAVECPFEGNEAIVHYVLTNPVFSDDSLTLASFECEHPDTSSERERHKGLKLKAGI